MDVNTYLNRIGFSGTAARDGKTLCELQSCHLLTVPYENLDIVHGKPLRLDTEGLYEKIVLHKRGGYCFELNGIFGALLRELGFGVTDCFARFLKGETEIPLRRHRVLRVEADDGVYLCDVGVGMVSPVYPVRLDTDEIQQIGNEQYKITHEDFFGTVLHQYLDGEWSRFFSFTDEPQLDKDFIPISYYCENHPDSIFIKRDMLAIYTRFGGKNALNGDSLTYWDEHGKHREEIGNEAQRLRAYSLYFGIDAENI